MTLSYCKELAHIDPEAKIILSNYFQVVALTTTLLIPIDNLSA